MSELTYDKVMEMFKENALQMKENERKAQEDNEKLRKQMEETDRRLGRLGNRLGDFVEEMVYPGIKEKFNKLGYCFFDVSKSREIDDPKTGKFLAEIDIYLESSDVVLAIEVKTKPTNEDVDYHASRMELIRKKAESLGDKRKYLGAIAGAIMSKETKAYAIKVGFYVLAQSGDAVKLDIPKDFVPHKW